MSSVRAVSHSNRNQSRRANAPVGSVLVEHVFQALYSAALAAPDLTTPATAPAKSMAAVCA